MALWLMLALMTALAASAVLLPLVRPNISIRSGSHLAVYRDQLEELERDRKGGLIGEAEAEAARLEVSRRLIAAADVGTVPAPRRKTPTWARRAVAVVALVALPIGATSLYLAIGSPLLPAQPLSARLVPPPVRSAGNLVSKLEAELRGNSDNGKRWEEIARADMQSERFNDATIAWQNALRLLGDSAERQSNLGQSIMAAANGIVTADAQAAFERAVALDPNMMIARYFLGVAAEQDGHREAAAQIWRNMIAAAPPGASWLGLCARVTCSCRNRLGQRYSRPKRRRARGGCQTYARPTDQHGPRDGRSPRRTS